MSKKKPHLSSEIIQIPIDLIDVNNYRNVISQEKVEELALTIGRVGLLQAIIVRASRKKGRYDLVFGERRLLATKHLGKTEIDARITTATDAQLPYMQLVENIQREDVSVMDECHRFHSMTKYMEVEDIAAEIGVSAQYVYDRMHLKRVIPAVVTLLTENHITFSHCLEFAKLTNPAMQKKLLERIRHNIIYNDATTEHRYYYKSVRETRRIIEKEFVVSLSTAIFDTEDRKLIKNKPCTTCPYRSGHNTKLFNNVESDDVCFSPGCFNDKTNRHLFNIESSLKAEGKEVVRINTNLINTEEDVAAYGELVPYSSLNVAAENDETETNTYGLIVVSHQGKNIGKLVKILPDSNVLTADIPGPKPLSKTEINSKVINTTARRNIRSNNAKIAFKNRVLADLADKIGTGIFEKIPLSLVKLILYQTLGAMDDDQRLSMLQQRRWTNNGNQLTDADVFPMRNTWNEVFAYNTQSFTDIHWIQFLIMTLVYGVVTDADFNETNPNPEMVFIYELMREFGFSPVKLKKDIESTFDVELPEIVIND